MILNIIPEDKFVPFLQGIFEEALPTEYAFRIIVNNPDSYPSETDDNVVRVRRSYLFSRTFLEDARQANCIVFHNLTVVHALALLRLPSSKTIVWRGWGCDYYELMRKEGEQYLLPKTRDLRSRQTFTSRLWRKLSSFEERFPFLLNRLLGQYIFRRAIPRVDYFSSCVPNEIDAVKSKLPYFTAKYVQLNYYSFEDIFMKGLPRGVSGNNILLGNSATATNNHLEAISHLSDIGVSGRSVITPLSYGDPGYRDLIIESAKVALGDAFVPLVDFMPIEEYNELTSSCSNVIMNHVRQQGIGNVSAAIMRGARVYLRKENPIYPYYRGLGVKLFSFPGDCTLSNLSTPLSSHDAKINRDIMTEHWGRKVAVDNARSLNTLVAR